MNLFLFKEAFDNNLYEKQRYRFAVESDLERERESNVRKSRRRNGLAAMFADDVDGCIIHPRLYYFAETPVAF